ncbi:acyl carrier protein [Micromonospora wenchangensis]|uniref:acyl carrier protein n=1 Tax=Micromonospora wenchangensis TaxID=1185415 RepID=UPI00382FF70E
MTTPSSGSFTEQDLKRILREGAGTGEGIDLDGDIHGVTFDELGYDSLALLETSTRIEREYGVSLGDEAITGDRTPGDVVALISTRLAEAKAR